MQLKFKIAFFIGGVLLLGIAIVSFIIIAGRDTKAPRIYFQQGAIEGRKFWSRNGKPFYGYLGIPYAEPAKRFQAPLEAATMWEGVLDATQYRSPCSQMDDISKTFIGEEDCLFINVFSPNLNGSFPVMFYIYGGGFLSGHAGLYKPDFMMDQDIVLVTFNYRVGAFGFLCTDDGEVQGNFGLKDQVIALRWVKKNIATFGGNPKQVTILGSSAGAASVSYQVLSPMSRDLFKNAIMQGGSALNPWAINLKPTGLTQKLGLQLGCITTRGNRELIHCIRGRPAEEIARQTFLKWHYDPHITYAPCIEKTRGSNAAFLSEHPYKILKDGRFNRVNVITGIGKDEGLLFHAATILRNKTLLAQLNEQFHRLAPITLVFDEDPAVNPFKWTEISSKIKSYYFPNNSVIGPETAPGLIDMYSDRWFIHGIQEEAFLLAKHTNVYPYILSYVGGQSVLEIYGIREVLGVAHGDDIQYFFDGIWSKPLSRSRDVQFSEQIIKLWASFAESGTPTAIWSPSNQVWPAISQLNVTKREMSWLELKEQTKIVRMPYKLRMNFWNHVLPFERS